MGRAGVRTEWTAVPIEVRDDVERALGSAVVSHRNVSGGFSPGPAGTALLADGRSVFVKACGEELNRRFGSEGGIVPR